MVLLSTYHYICGFVKPCSCVCCGVPACYLPEPTMENEAGDFVDLYCPRKCSASNRIIHAKDHASIQLNIADVDSTGRILETSKMYAICGAIRRMGESDDCIGRLAKEDGVLPKLYYHCLVYPIQHTLFWIGLRNMKLAGEMEEELLKLRK